MSQGSVPVSRLFLPAVFVLGFLVVGVPFWLIPYSSVTVPNSFFGLGAVTVFVLAAFLGFRVGFWKGLLVAGAVMPSVLMCRVVVEALVEPTRHNLWPLALMIVVVMAIGLAGIGSLLGWVVAKVGFSLNKRAA
jgi:hypothetical protein